ncbi:MAG: class I SAM-dependent methyltransferase [Fibromonadaceae bacterium]|jgi:O-antigen chain-terminating methyltransferase|nr:class I SAM-dependent methyltransferase [Fibromonadaceae bacterium]
MFYDFYLNRKTGRLAKFQAERLIPALAKPALHGLPQSPKVLEIGVGRGDFAQYLKSIGVNYTGIEANSNLCNRLNEQGFNVIYSQVPPFPKELERETYDLVVMCHIFEHLKDWQEALKVLGEIFALLKPGGRLLLFHPDYLDWGMDYFDRDYSHSLILTRNRVDNLVSDSGFKIIHRDSFRSFFRGIKPFSWLLAKVLNCTFGKPKIAFKLNLLTICEKVNE